jgi:predicted glycogen debranching enzyme
MVGITAVYPAASIIASARSSEDALIFGPEVLRNLTLASSREWLLTDGLGGYASSTLLGLNTRRYHGLLVVATRPPLGRMVLLAKLDETLVLDDRRHELATNVLADSVEPRGFDAALRFSLDPLPTLTWAVDGGTLTRSVARVHGEPATACVYAYEGARPASLELRPLVAFRDHHALQHENAALDPAVVHEGPDVVLRPYPGCPELRLRVPEGGFEADARWFRRFVYERERERGYEFEEDLFGHGVFRVTLYPGEVATLLAWSGPIPAGVEAVELLAAERTRLRQGPPGFLGDLGRAADAFVVRRGEAGRSVIAGYPWYCDGGRDAMIALPGLCLSTRRYAEARRILLEQARHLDAGSIPSRFLEGGGAPEYDAADAPLWMVIAVQRYLDATGDRAFVRRALQPVVFAILDGYRRGARHGVRMTPEGLLSRGQPGGPATWMDARLDGALVTPRDGAAVELQALWYNALLVGAALAGRDGDARRSREWTSLASLARGSFVRVFWAEQAGYLADVVRDGVRDLSLRPNQLWAVGLPHALLPLDKAARVLDAVKRELLTPAGLRSIAPSDPGYRAVCDEAERSRGGACHQGTVWPFLMGVYFDALIRVHGEAGAREARDWLRDFEGHLEEAGVGFVGELFDGDPPHRARGAIAQAWSVAELLRIADRVAAR